jgi:hypothetical protein
MDFVWNLRPAFPPIPGKKSSSNRFKSVHHSCAKTFFQKNHTP